MKKMMLAFLFGMAALFCCGQSFLLKYPNLTKRNLSEFFLDWKVYSDSVYSNNVVEDSVLAVFPVILCSYAYKGITKKGV